MSDDSREFTFTVHYSGEFDVTISRDEKCYHDVESARVLFVAEEGTLPLDSLTHAPRQEAKVARHALAEALLGIEATTVEEYRDRAHALAMNWKGEV